MKPTVVFSIVLGFVGFVLLLNSTFIVRETDQAMVLALGKVDRVIAAPGLHFKMPFFQQVVYFDKRILETDSPAEEVQAGDKKRVVVDSFTRWRITDAKKFFENLRTESAARNRITSIVNSSLKDVLGGEDLAELVSGQRAEVMGEIVSRARQETDSLGIEIVDVRIKRADLPAENSQAVYRRMQAERDKEAKEIRAKGEEEAQKIRANAEKERTIVLAEANRDSQKIRGEGDAESIRIFANATRQDPNFYSFVRSLEAYRNSLKGDETMMVLDPTLEFFKHLNNGK